MTGDILQSIDRPLSQSDNQANYWNLLLQFSLVVSTTMLSALIIFIFCASVYIFVFVQVDAATQCQSVQQSTEYRW